MFIGNINIIDFGVLTLHPAFLPNWVICLRGFIVDYIGFSKHTIIPSIKKETFISTFPMCMRFVVVVLALLFQLRIPLQFSIGEVRWTFCVVPYLAATAAAAKSLQSCPTLGDPIDSSPPGSPIPGILQARTLEWVAISFSNAGKWKVKVKSLSHSDPMDCSLPGSSIHGIFQARVLEWGAIAFSGSLS